MKQEEEAATIKLCSCANEIAIAHDRIRAKETDGVDSWQFSIYQQTQQQQQTLKQQQLHQHINNECEKGFSESAGGEVQFPVQLETGTSLKYTRIKLAALFQLTLQDLKE